MKTFIYRLLIIATVICSALYVSSVDSIKDMGVFTAFTILTIVLCWASWLVFKDINQEDLYEILFVNKFKKIGFDIDEFYISDGEAE